MNSLITSITILFFTSLALADAPPVVLEKGKNFYELGLHLDILEDTTGKLGIRDVTQPRYDSKFKKSKDKVPNFGFSDSSFWAKIKIKNNIKNKD